MTNSDLFAAALDVLTPIPGSEEELETPSYSTPGRILFGRWLDEENDDFEVLDHDGDTSVYWIGEELSLGYFIDDIMGLPSEPGHYIVHGITGQYSRGDGWETDDDVEWSWTSIEKLPEPLMELPPIAGEPTNAE